MPERPIKIDIGKALAGAAAAAHIGPRVHLPRWRLALGGLIVAGLAAWAITRNETLRARLAGATYAMRERISAMRSNRFDGLKTDRDDPIAFDAAETAPIEASPLTESTAIDASGYPASLASNNAVGMPVFEETVSVVSGRRRSRSSGSEPA